MNMQQYITFTGRDSRSDFWGIYVFIIIIGLALSPLLYVAEIVINDIYLFLLLSLLTWPLIATTARRLHDLNHSAWWLLLTFIPIVGYLLFIYVGFSRGTTGPNRFGADPIVRIQQQF